MTKERLLLPLFLQLYVKLKDDINCWNTNFNEDMIVAVVIAI